MRKVDMFNHIWPTEFFDALVGHIGQMTDIAQWCCSHDHES